MKYRNQLLTVCLSLIASIFVSEANASEVITGCYGYGSQEPRNIDNKAGKNDVILTQALKAKDMNICDVHFHKSAEHKAKNFAIEAGKGYKCEMSQRISKAERESTKDKFVAGNMEIYNQMI